MHIPNKIVFSINEFVEYFSISRAHLYKQWSLGAGPAFFHIGRRRFISLEAAEKWLKELEKKGEEK